MPDAADGAGADRMAIGSPLPVRWSDLDSYGHVNNVKFFDYLQEARIALFTDAALGWSETRRQRDLGARPPGSRLPAAAGLPAQPVRGADGDHRVGNRSVTLAAEILDPDDRPVFATARSVMVGQPR